MGLLSARCVYDLSTRPSKCWLILAVGQESVRTKALRSAGLVRKQIRPRATVWVGTDDIYDEANDKMTGWSNEQSMSTGAGNNCPCGWWCSASNQRNHLNSHSVFCCLQPKPSHKDDRLKERPDVTCTSPARGPKPRMSQKRQVRCRSWMSAGVCACVMDKQDSASCHDPSVPETSLKFERLVILSNIIDLIVIRNLITRS